MAKRKSNKGSNIKPKPKVDPKAQKSPASRFAAMGVIAGALLVLVFYAATGSGQKAAQSGPDVLPASQAPLAPPMTGVETSTVGTVEEAKAKVTTFKMTELAGWDCVEQINAELRRLGGVGNVRADYTNALLEIQYDPAKVTEAKIIEAFNKANHPGQVTSEKIVGS